MHKLLLVVLMFVLVACDFVPEKVSWDDARIAPMLKAIEAADRNALGFTPIQRNATVSLENRPRVQYDAMLHIYGDTSRTIAFRKNGNEYKWISEQEIYTGPKTYKTVDGTLREQIVVTYGIESVSGHEPKKLHVEYWGEDTRLAGRQNLTLKKVQPILTEWKSVK